MPPLFKKLIDVAIAVGLTAGIVLVMVVTSNLLVARANSFVGFKIWYAFVTRPDILGTIVLTALVSAGYALWQQKGRAR